MDPIVRGTDAAGSATAGRARLSARAGQAEHAVGHRLQAGGRYGVAAGVAHAVGPLVELRQRTLGARQPGLQRAPDADVGQPADRLDRAVADALAEPLRAA